MNMTDPKRGTWLMLVAAISLTMTVSALLARSVRADEPAGPTVPHQWHEWKHPPRILDKKVERHPVQNFFPFGYWVCGSHTTIHSQEIGESVEEVTDGLLKQIADAGCNMVKFVNFQENFHATLGDLARKHKLRYMLFPGNVNAWFAGPDPQAHQAYLDAARRVLLEEQDNPDLLAFSLGEEFSPAVIKQLDGFHELVQKVDPAKLLFTNHNQIMALAHSAKHHDVRVAMRDAYPYYLIAKHGPTTHAQSMAYLDREMNLAWQHLPEGSSLWFMGQAGCDYINSEEADLHPGEVVQYLARPSPAQMRAQTWGALANGATGFVYWMYAGAIFDAHRPSIPEGLLNRDWTVNESVAEVSRLARLFLPHGDLIANLERTELPAFTSNANVRAYVCSDRRDQQLYLVVQNRLLDDASTADIIVRQQTGSMVRSILDNRQVKVRKHGNEHNFQLTLEPAGGALIRLKQ